MNGCVEVTQPDRQPALSPSHVSLSSISAVSLSGLDVGGMLRA
jgi:hypothetical protein